MLEKSQNWVDVEPSAQSPLEKWLSGNSGQKLKKKRYQSFFFFSNFVCFFKNFTKSFVQRCKSLSKQFNNKNISKEKFQETSRKITKALCFLFMFASIKLGSLFNANNTRKPNIMREKFEIILTVMKEEVKLMTVFSAY